MSSEDFGIINFTVYDRISEIKQALKNKMYQSALALSLTLPDICNKIARQSDRVCGDDYIEWFNKHASSKFPNLLAKKIESYYYLEVDKTEKEDGSEYKPAIDGNICYHFRNSFLHAGNNDIQHKKYPPEGIVETGVKEYMKSVKYSIQPTLEEDCLDWSTNRANREREYIYHFNVEKFCLNICEATAEFLQTQPEEKTNISIFKLFSHTQFVKDQNEFWKNSL